VNSNVAAKVRATVNGEVKTLEFTFSDIMYAIEIAGLNCLMVSDTGAGKTQAVSDIAWNHFGGDNNGGSANWADGRPNFEITDLFERTQVDTASGSFDSETARTVKQDRIERTFFAVDEINRAPGPKQNEFFDLADGKYTFNGRRLSLGKDGYSIFFATANLNKVNGDFTVFELDRALLNRAHVTLDMDHYAPTFEDELLIEERKVNPKVDVAQARDISAKIIGANNLLKQKMRNVDPYFMAFRFMVGKGLDYCEQDTYDEKGDVWPMNCSDCSFTKPDLCSMIKSSSTRTITGVKSLAYAISYLAELKYGKDIELDTFDTLLQAFKFTTYHGNLNHVMEQDTYGMRKQRMMNETVDKLGEQCSIVGEYIPIIKAGHDPVLLEFTQDGDTIKTAADDGLQRTLDEKGISYSLVSLEDELN